MANKNEGWGWMPTSRKKHYFIPVEDSVVAAESLCQKWEIRLDHYAGLGGLKKDDDDDPNNCAVCQRKKRQSRKRLEDKDEI